MITFDPTLLFLQAADVAETVGESIGVDTTADSPLVEQLGEITVEEVSPGLGVGARLAITLAVFFLPFILAVLIANALKVKDMVGRLGACLLALTLGIAPIAIPFIQGVPFDEVFRQGIDLAGGTNLVYQVEETAEKQITNQVMGQMIGAVGRRINPSGTEEVTVRQVGADRIEVIIPGADPASVRDKKREMTRLGSLEFMILANRADHSAICQGAEQMPDNQTEYRRGGRVLATWREVGEKNGVPKDVTPQSGDGGSMFRTVKRVRIRDGNKALEDITEVLCVREDPKRRVTGEYLTRAEPTMNQNGQQVVRFRFNQRGGYLFQSLTSKNQPRRDGSKRRLAVLLDNKVHSAPSINSVISDEGVIEGDFTRTEITELTNVLNAGALEVPIKPDPISEATIDPLLGQDIREKGIRAIAIAAIAVVIFMILYYRFAGIVAVLCLALNLVLVLGIMVLIKAAFTLPGLAGFVLTIGMAVDANVLIFERIREELNRGSSLRMAIRNGFDRAFTTIVDANVTTLITAVILFMIGTDQVRGFAVTLFIGIVMSMFASLYFGRLIFDLFERKRWITRLSMASIVGKTNWDFIGKRGICSVISACLIAVGLVAFFSRGEKNYDIDFTGGTMVTFQFTENQETPAVREQLGKTFETFSLERLSLAGEAASSGGRRFRLRTTMRDADQPEDGADAATTDSARDTVRTMVNGAFENSEFELLRITMDPGAPEAIPEVEGDDEDAKLLADEYAGGNKVKLSYSSEVTEASIRDSLAAAFNMIQEGGKPKYDQPEGLFELTGTDGSGIEAADDEVKKFSDVEVKVARDISADDLSTALASIQSSMNSQPHFDEVNSFASSVASEMKQSAIVAIIASLIAVIAYIWFRFQRITFGLAAVAALVHDVLVVLGAVALGSYLSGNAIGDIFMLNDFRINLPMIAAFLTIVGYSLNDTIVVFDRIREVRGKNPALTEEMVNTSLNQTLSRTLLTSITTFIVVAILYAIGGEGIHGFAFCLVIGVIVGTYSSIYVASPVLIWLMNRNKKDRKSAAPAASAKTAAATS